MLVVEVDRLDAETLQRSLAGGFDVLRLAVDPDPAAVVGTLVAELRRQHDLVALAGDGLADELLVATGAVHVCGVEEVGAELDCAMDRRDRLSLVGRSVELRHPHAAETDRADLEVAQLPRRHPSSLIACLRAVCLREPSPRRTFRRPTARAWRFAIRAAIYLLQH